MNDERRDDDAHLLRSRGVEGSSSVKGEIEKEIEKGNERERQRGRERERKKGTERRRGKCV